MNTKPKRTAAALALTLTLILVHSPVQARTTCATTPGAPPGAAVIANDAQLQAAMADGLVSHAVVAFDWHDDQANVDGTDVTFRRVTFRGTGDGHTIKATRGARLTVDHAAFESDPHEDHIQLEGHGRTLVRCSRFGLKGHGSMYGNPSDPENQVDIKAGGDVAILGNQFYAFPHQGECILANNGAKTVRIEDNNPCNGGIYLRGNVTGTLARNNINGDTWLDEVNDMVIQGNDFRGYEVRYGAGSTPNGNWFRNNRIGSPSAWDYRNGTCYRNHNHVRLDPCIYRAP
jgi:hypothetical protein